MKVEIVNRTNSPEDTAGRAAALCYNGKNPTRSLEVAMAGHH